MKINIKTNVKDISKRLNKVQREVLPKATNRTLNRVGGRINTQVKRYVAKEAGITQKDLTRRGFFAFFKSNLRSLSYSVIVRYGAIPLKDFNPRQTRKGVTAKAWGKRKVYEGAFIVDKLGRHVFARKGKGRTPIKKLYGAIPSRVAQTQELESNIERVVDERLGLEMNANIQYYASRLLAKRASG